MYRIAPPSILAATLCAAMLCAAAPARATSFVGLDDGALADRAELIVEARVLALAAAPGARPAIDYRLAVEGAIKGAAPADELELRLPGGVRPDGTGLRLLGVPVFAAGERALLFLRPRGDGGYVLADLILGAFAIAGDGPGALALRDPGAARELRLPGREKAADGSRDLARFRLWLRDHAGGVERPADYFVAAPEAPPEKFALFVSSTLPQPLGCGDEGGHSLRWTDFDHRLEVFWSRHRDGQPGLADGGEGAFARARAAWNTTATLVALADGGSSAASAGFTTPDGENVLLFGDPNDELPGRFAGGGLLALGGIWFQCSERAPWGGVDHHVAREADVVIQDGVEDFLLASDDPEAAAEELYGHELGHTLGLAHSAEPEALMLALIHDDGRGARLDDDDHAALELLYREPPGGVISPPPPPEEPPPAPTELDAVLVDDTTVELIWSHPRPRDGVRIERRLEDGEPVLVATVGGRTRFLDAGLLPGRVYGYRIQASSAAGVSPYTEEARIETRGSLAPAAPSNLRAAPLSTSRIQLRWQDNADDELFQRIELRRDAAGEPWQALPTVAASATTLEVDGLEPATGYRFRVRAEGLLDASEPSNVVATATFDPGAGCVSSPRRLCLLGGRFAVEVRWRNPRDGSAGTGTMVPATDKVGEVWFFRPGNVELIVKMLDGSRSNGHAWVFYGGLSSLEYWITITDTASGERREYHNPLGEVCGRADTLAFPLETAEKTLPAPGAPDPGVADRPRGGAPAAPCADDPASLCLVDGRFRVQVAYRNQHDGGREGLGRSIFGSENSGAFWFFNEQNTELVLKILDGRRNNGHFWLFYGALSNLEYWITATDVQTGISRVYHNPPGEICGLADLFAFADG